VPSIRGSLFDARLTSPFFILPRTPPAHKRRYILTWITLRCRTGCRPRLERHPALGKLTLAIGRRIENLDELRKIGFAANRRLLDVQRIGHHCFIGEASFQDMQKPIMVNQHRAAALRFADPRVHALLHVMLLFLLVQGTFTHKVLREHLAPLLGKKPSQLTPGRITYDLRRLRLHGLIERIPKTHRYRITAKGLRTAVFYNSLYNRSLRTGLAIISPCAANSELPIAKSIRAAENAVNKWCQHQKLAA
jgi:hypothetical protein